MLLGVCVYGLFCTVGPPRGCLGNITVSVGFFFFAGVMRMRMGGLRTWVEGFKITWPVVDVAKRKRLCYLVKCMLFYVGDAEGLYSLQTLN